jgi:hypothetical protein
LPDPLKACRRSLRKFLMVAVATFLAHKPRMEDG